MNSALPLSGIRVLDLTVVWAGPAATQHLADLGAEVIRIESAHRVPSSTRAQPHVTADMVKRMGMLSRMSYPGGEPQPQPYNRTSSFNVLNRNKLSATMELDTPEGKEGFRRLVEISDILVENNAQRIGDRLGFSWKELSAINPKLILCRMPPLGLTGPYANYLGFGAHFEALSGLTWLRAYPDADPSRTSPTFHMDDVSPTVAAFMILGALHRRRRTGEGGLIEIPQAETMLHQIGDVVLDYSMNGRTLPPPGNRHHLYAPQGCYRCRGDDQWVVLSVRDDGDWQRLVQAIGAPEWARDPAYATVNGRHAHHDQIDHHLNGWTHSRNKLEVFHLLQEHGVPAAPVQNEADTFADPQVNHRGLLRPLRQESTGVYNHPRQAYLFSDMALRWERGAPTLGEDNAYVYKELLGYSEQAYRDLEARGLIGTNYAVERPGGPGSAEAGD